jgi:hypothetical protein
MAQPSDNFLHKCQLRAIARRPLITSPSQVLRPYKVAMNAVASAGHPDVKLRRT